MEQHDPQQHEPSVGRYVSVTVLCAVIVLGAFILSYPPSVSSVGPMLIFAAALAAVQMLPVPVPHGRDVELVRLDEAVLVPIMLVLAPTEAVVTALAGVVLGAALLRAEPIRTAFNAAQITISVAAGVLVWSALAGTSHPRIDDTAMLAAVPAVLAYALVNRLLTGKVLSLAGGVPYREVLTRDLGLAGQILASTILVGLLTALAVEHAPWLAVVCLVPLLVLHRSYLAYVERSQHQRDLRQLHRHADAMGSATTLREAVFSLLDNARHVAGADCAWLRIDGDQNVYVVDASGTAVHASDRWRPPGGAHLEFDIAGPRGLTTRTGVASSRSVVAGEAFSQRERELVEMLAHQGSIGIENAWLLQQVSAERTRFERIFEHSSEGLIVVGENGRILAWNPAMERLTGLPAHEVVQSHIGMLGAEFESICSQDEAAVLRAVIVTRDQRVRNVEAHVATTRDPDAVDAQSRLWVVVVHDITSRVEAERLKDDFVATVSHELRTPLTAIKGFIDTMQRTDIALAQGSTPMFLDVMAQQATRLERLITDLLDIGAIESGRTVDLHLEPVDVPALLERTLQGFEAAHPECTVLRNAPEQPLLAIADRHRLEQVLTNLLENARRHGCAPGEAPRIEVALEHVPGSCRIEVCDNGQGIAAEQQELIFDRFYRGTRPQERQTGGAGLGLYICRRLVDAMGGTIGVRSAPGSGACFRIDLPCAASPDEALSDEAPGTTTDREGVH